MTGKNVGALLPGSAEVPFAEIETALARIAGDRRRKRRSSARAQTATVVVIGEGARLVPAAEALEHLCDACGVRAILVSEGSKNAPTAHVSEFAIAIEGMKPRFVDNAVAALRLSSLPMVVWWRGASLESLDHLTLLADRFVIDVDDPGVIWPQAPSHFEKTAITDLRWTRLTRWRAQLAHLFDLSLLGESGAIERLEIEASDLPSARLFAGWLKGTLHWTPATAIEIKRVKGDINCPLESVRLQARGGVELILRVMPARTCIEASVTGTSAASSRIVQLGDGSLNTLIAEELGVRTRDLAFEQALVAALEMTV